MVCVALNTVRTCEFERLYSWLMRLWAGRFVAFREFVAFMGHWGWTFVAFMVFVLFMECLGWMFMKFTAFVVFNLVKCNLTKLTTTSLAVKRCTSLAV